MTINLAHGSSGPKVADARLRLTKNRWGINFNPGSGSAFDAQMGRACQRAKWRLGYPSERCTPRYGDELHSYLVPKDWAAAARLPLSYHARKLARRGRQNPYREEAVVHGGSYPLAKHGTLIGWPYQGSHSHPSPSDDLHNWESCNAIDIAIPTGTEVLAVADGVIGEGWGPLDSSNPVLAGQRIHLVTNTNEYYYAHLSRLGPHPGTPVRAGDSLGRSGAANGVEHLHFASHHGDPARYAGSKTPGYSDRGYPG